MTKDEIFEEADRAWEQFEFNGRGVKVTLSNYDAVRTAYMEGFTKGIEKILTTLEQQGVKID